ncbi:MAG TPA: tetratricopeptide repeat protein [Methylomirabilota bacterium]|nr:tetratricopeptide repeat protein [Methylomirabilota bacterium]
MEYYDLGSYTRRVTTAVPDAQLWFDRGLNWLYGFNHGEAIACFKKALELDADCAMAYWGISYAAGPNYNLPWHLYDPAGKAAALAIAYDAMQGALARVSGASPVEQALIRALPARYPQREAIEDQAPWDAAYADAMREVFRAHRDDLEVRHVFAESIMNLTPWKMWDLKTGGIAEGAGTAEAVEVLERAFRDIPASWSHPGLLHLYVHLMEMSPFPQRALRAGDRLRDLVPDAGHLIHMPTHIDVLCGHYRDVLVYNQKAIVADRKFLAREGALNVYALYRTHDYHFAVYGAMFLGQYGAAMAAAQELIDTTPEELLRIPSPPMADFVEGYLPMKQHVLVRFGKWHEIIAQKLPGDRELYCSTTAMMLYAQAVAHSALGHIAEAEAAKAAFIEAKRRVPESRRVHNNTVRDLLEIAHAMLDGELEYRRGNHEVAFAHLRRSVELDDALPYDEPWGWMQPTRHALGALLLEQGRVAEAEAIYRSDLGLDGKLSRACQHPDNLWSLHGLHECLTRRGETVEAALIKQRLDLALARAEVPVKASCFCRMKVAA